MKQRHRISLLLFSVVGVIVVVLFTSGEKPALHPGVGLALRPPAFVEAASPESAPPEIGEYLGNEAGISAYVQTSGPIDLNLVRSIFKVIETETSDYIIGSVDLANYPEHFDTHVYVHSDGWVLAYYMNDVPASKMIDTRAQTIASTNLESIVSAVTGAAGFGTSNLAYYDFRYPNATNILLVAEDAQDGSAFTIELPTDYAYYERSWAGYDTLGSVEFWIDGDQAPRQYWHNGYHIAYGEVPAASLLPGSPHVVAVNSDRASDYGILVITYRVP